MIVITGPGRGGTSLIAALYRELGFDPGGQWLPSVRAGFEAADVTAANRALMDELGVSYLGRDVELPPTVRAGIRRVVPSRLRRSVFWRTRPARAGTLDWTRVPALAEEWGGRLRGLSESHVVVKDPQFCWTLKVWALAGATIDHVVVCVRALDAMVDSRERAGQLRLRTRGAALDSFTYGIGLCAVALFDHRIPHAFLRFPDVVRDPEALFRVLPFPRPCSYEAFSEAFNRVFDEEMIHDWR